MKKLLQYLFLFLPFSCLAQTDSILHQNIWRTFTMHLPTNYQAQNNYPLVLNLHGLNSSGIGQQGYSKFDEQADIYDYIVVYPDAINGSWSFNNNSDVDFIIALIDTIRSRYSCSNQLFSMGMSQGGFLTYKLATELSQEITAIAVVSGGMSKSLQDNASISKPIPVMHFHGTADQLVKFNGSVGVPPVDSTIAWWIDKNKADGISLIYNIPDTITNDSSSVEVRVYSPSVNGAEVIYYVIDNGGHTWPSAIPLPLFGFTNRDVDASKDIAAFFNKYVQVQSVNVNSRRKNLTVFPNPSKQFINVQLPVGVKESYVFDVYGRLIFKSDENEQTFVLNIESYAKGMYFIKVMDIKGNQYTGSFVKN